MKLVFPSFAFFVAGAMLVYVFAKDSGPTETMDRVARLAPTFLLIIQSILVVQLAQKIKRLEKR